MNTTKPMTGRPVIVGEVLFDRFPDGTEVLGGAPFNVAWHLHGFGCNPLLISRVGDDERGRRVQEAMCNWGMDTSGMQVDFEHATGLVDISFEDKEHSFEILANRAYDYIDAGLSQDALRGIDIALAYHGTLILRTREARGALNQLVTKVGMPVFVDVNLRHPWWREEDFWPLLQRARWVKVNDEELNIIAERVGLGTTGMEETARRLRDRFDQEMLILTLGAQGAVALDASDVAVRVAPAPDAEVVDTVGAGDAFSSVVLAGLLKDWPIPLIMRRAQEFAGRVCAQRGATSRDLGLYETMTC